jgi:hypothetical protein
VRYGVQDVAVALLAVAALGWLVWRRVRARRGRAVAACPDCPVGAPTPGTRPPPMPTVRPTTEGAAFLARRRGPRLIQIRRPGEPGPR